MRINFIGCGRLGKTLGRLFVGNGVFEVGAVVTRSLETARDAVAFIGQGTPADSLDSLNPAEVVLVAVPDDALEPVVHNLARTDAVRPGDVVFHASGSRGSDVLGPLSDLGAHVASVHPVQSFARPAESATRFAGTWCGMEGDEQALQVLEPAVRSIGGIPFAVDRDAKLFYHAGAVFACNYLNVLVEIASLCYEKAGVRRDDTATIFGPLVRQTLENILKHGPAEALTGPVARGDVKLVERQGRELAAWREDVGAAYGVLGHFATGLARRNGNLSAEVLEELEDVMRGFGR